MENQVITKIIEKLKTEHKIKAKWIDHKHNDNPNKELDGKLDLYIKNKKLEFFVEFKREIRKHHLLQIDNYKAQFPELLVIADFINPKIREILKDKEVNYIDGAGNMYINRGDQLIFIEGKKNEIDQNYYKGRLFGKGGIKIIYAILVNEDIINKPYREIAEQTDTALGTVNYIMKELMINGYLIFINKNVFRLNNKKDLMNKWITGYEDKLKKTLFIGKFRFNNNDWKNIKFKNDKTFWGGEPAAEILTKYLIPQNLTVYTMEETKELVKDYFLIPDANGNVEVYKKFWKIENNLNFKEIVPALLVYADLIITGNDRNIETANIIYERYLQNKFE